MEPRTKFEQRVVQLSALLPPITDAQEQWMLKQVDPHKSTSWYEYEFSILQKIEDCQVFRVFQIACYNNENRSGYAREHSVHKTFSNIGECYQVWVNTKGQRALLGYDLKMFWQYCRAIHKYHRGGWIQWTYENGEYKPHARMNKMHIKDPSVLNSGTYRYYYGCAPEMYSTTSGGMLCPIGMEFLDEFVRNNGGTDFNGYEGDKWMKYMLTPETESLWKINKDLFKFYVENVSYNHRKLFYTALKIANRHKYHGLSKDEIMIWKDMIKCHIKLGNDLHNPHFVCPKDLKAMHDDVVRKAYNKEQRDQKRREYERMMSELQREEMERKSYHARVEPYKDLVISDEMFDIYVCPTIEDMVEEGKQMHNCVGRMGYHKKKDSLILLVRNKKGEREADIEFSKSRESILQCYAPCNKIHKEDKRIRNLVMVNVDLLLNPQQSMAMAA